MSNSTINRQRLLYGEEQNVIGDPTQPRVNVKAIRSHWVPLRKRRTTEPFYTRPRKKYQFLFSFKIETFLVSGLTYIDWVNEQQMDGQVPIVFLHTNFQLYAPLR